MTGLVVPAFYTGGRPPGGDIQQLVDILSQQMNEPAALIGAATVTTSLTNGIATLVNMDTEVYDNDGMHSTVTNPERIVVQTAGTYEVIGSIGFSVNVTGYRIILVTKNGGAFARAGDQAGPVSVHHVIQARGIVQCSVGDYFQVFGQQASGGNLATIASPAYTYFLAHRVSD